MKRFNTNAIVKFAIAAVAFAAAGAGAASAQDYNDWSSISPWGLEMQDQYGDIHYVDPYAYDSQVDIYGNVYSDYNGEMDPSIGMYDLTPAWQDNSYDTGSEYSWSEYDSSAYSTGSSSSTSDSSWIWE
ncbi:MAG: hypothetical protein AAGJ32_07195 [Pseudomonadota bacterium]